MTETTVLAEQHVQPEKAVMTADIARDTMYRDPHIITEPGIFHFINTSAPENSPRTEVAGIIVENTTRG